MKNEITDIITELENSSQLNVDGIRELIRPLVAVMPEMTEGLYNSLDNETNTLGVIMALKRIQTRYEESSPLYKLKVGLRNCTVWMGEHRAQTSYRVL